MTELTAVQPPNKVKLTIVSVIIGLLGGILLIGIPGALLLELIALTYEYFGLTPLDLPGDSVWPIAIMLSLLWPMPITPLSVLHHKMLSHPSVLSRWLFSIFGSLILTAVITFICFL